MRQIERSDTVRKTSHEDIERSLVMNKRITSLLLCFVMVFAMLATAVPAFAAEGKTTYFKMTADKAEANPGDTITYTIALGPVETLRAIKFKLEIPEGLTYVEGSGKAVDGLLATLNNAQVAEFTESTKVFVVATASGYTSTSETVLMTFQCTVDEGVSGDITATMYVPDEDDIFDTDYDNIAFTITNDSAVEIVPAPVAATGVSLDQTSLTLTAGESGTLTATVTPADASDAVTWTSSDTSVATVDANGNVTAVSKGTATITAKAGDVSATCKVTVNCAHKNIVEVAEKDSTCKDQGWDAYKKCDDCEQLYDTSDKEIDAIPYRDLLTTHTGGNATCTAQAVCTVCGKSYGEYADHSFTAETEKDEALTAAVDCQHKAVYYYSCSACGEVESDDDHTFEGDYGAHTEATAWTTDETSHWHLCTVCGEVVESSKDTHTPDHTGSATEEYAIKCSDCGYVIEQQLAHTHSYDQEVATEAYLATEATCTVAATYYKSCTCGEKGTETFSSGEAKGHTFDQQVATDACKATDATCTAAATYYKSCTCGEKGTETFSNGEAKGHTEATEWKSDETNHWHICTVCGEVMESSKAAHTPDHEGSATAAYDVKCSVCGYVISKWDSNEGNGGSGDNSGSDNGNGGGSGSNGGSGGGGHVHDLEKVEAVDATCTDDGNVEYYFCTICEKLYEDENATALIEDEEDVVVPTPGHSYVIDEAVAATCTEAGLTAGVHCENCGEVLVAQEAVPALGHSYVIDEAVIPTCTEAGLTLGVHCEACGDVLLAQEEISAPGHLAVTEKEVSAGCDSTGLTEGQYCAVCGQILVAQEEIPATGEHIYGEWEVVVEATKKQEGQQVHTCLLCGNEETQSVEQLKGSYVWIIVVSSIGVVGAGAVALYFLYFKKKKK